MMQEHPCAFFPQPKELACKVNRHSLIKWHSRVLITGRRDLRMGSHETVQGWGVILNARLVGDPQSTPLSYRRAFWVIAATGMHPLESTAATSSGRTSAGRIQSPKTIGTCVLRTRESYV